MPYEETDNAAASAAKLIAEGKIVSWFQGRMEYGARALGNRSILANPISPDIKDKVNDRVKYRESWRPFCPSLAAESVETYIADPNEASFMIVAYHIREEMSAMLPSVVHVDGTIRPQAVTREANPLFHELLGHVGTHTGHPVVLNTSFNVRGEPIICTPRQALQCFYSTGLDALMLGNFLLTKH